MRIALIFGGRNCEHEVSLRSAANVRAALQEAGHEVVDIGITPAGHWRLTSDGGLSLPHPALDTSRASLVPLPDFHSQLILGEVDVVFPMVHGPTGEDGALQGLLELTNVPYVGCGVLGSALAMDKDVAKRLWQAADLPVTRYIVLQGSALSADGIALWNRVHREVGLPAFVKPANLGSSVGVSRVENEREMEMAICQAFQYDEKILIEAAVPHAREFEVSVLGRHELLASIPGEIRLQAGFYDYDAKYTNSLADLRIPAAVSPYIVSQLQELAIHAFRTLEGCGMGRVDFLMDGQSQEIFLNEVNTIPGFTSISMYPKLWEASGLSRVQLMQRLLDIALERHAAKQRLCTSYA